MNLEREIARLEIEIRDKQDILDEIEDDSELEDEAERLRSLIHGLEMEIDSLRESVDDEDDED